MKSKKPEGKPLNKPMRGDVKKYKVYVRDPETGNTKKVNFGDKTMEIKRDDPERRRSFRARHNCAEPGPKTKARYWSCKMWSSKPVSEIVKADAGESPAPGESWGELKKAEEKKMKKKPKLPAVQSKPALRAKAPDEILPATKPAADVETEPQEFEMHGQRVRVSVKTTDGVPHAHIEHHDGEEWRLTQKVPVQKLGEGVYGGVVGGAGGLITHNFNRAMGYGTPMITASLQERKVKKCEPGQSYNDLKKSEEQHGEEDN